MSLAPGALEQRENKPVLLVVDDQPVNIQALHAVFGADHQVLMATSGEKALQVCRETLPDVMLLDVGMPGMDGYEVLRRLKADARLATVPVIFVTAHDSAEDEAMGLGLGAVDYIAKPFKPAVVRARVRTHVELVRSRRQQHEHVQAQARMDAELETARRIQMGLLPDVTVLAAQCQGLDLCARLEPTRAVGGDFYDLVRLDDERVFFAVGDVAGKGVPAALFMALAKTHLRAGVARWGGDLGLLLSRTSQELARQNSEQLFVTAFAGVLDLRHGFLSYCSAGHVVPSLIGPDGQTQALDDAQGPPLCALDDFRYEQRGRSLRPGDALFVVSDGVTEAQGADGGLFGAQGLSQALRRCASAHGGTTSPSALVEAVRQAVRAFTGRDEPADDLTLLCLRRRP